MQRFIILFLLPSLSGALLCTAKYNVVRSTSDKYLEVDRYSLATEHQLEGPGDVLSNYSKGQRKMRVAYFRKFEKGRMMQDEMRLEVQFFNDDPAIGDKIIILVNDKPIPMNNIRWTLENKREPGSYQLATFMFFPPQELRVLFHKVASMGIRIKLGTEAATAAFDLPSLKAVRQFYSNKTES